MGSISELVDWDFVKKIAGSRIVAISTVFPFLGYIALLNADAVELFRLFFEVSEQTEANTRARIEEIYFALIWISCGAILFQIFCPNEVKRFSSRYEFLENEIEISGPIRLQRIKDEVISFREKWWISNNLEKEIALLQNADVAVPVNSKHEMFGYASGNPSRQDYLSAVGNAAIELLVVYFDCKLQSRPVLRIGLLIIMSIGYIKLSIPSFKVFWHLLTS